MRSSRAPLARLPKGDMGMVSLPVMPRTELRNEQSVTTCRTFRANRARRSSGARRCATGRARDESASMPKGPVGQVRDRPDWCFRGMCRRIEAAHGGAMLAETIIMVIRSMRDDLAVRLAKYPELQRRYLEGDATIEQE